MIRANRQTLAERLEGLPTAARQWTPGWRPIRVPMTFREYLEAPLPHGRFEWENGEAVELPAVDLQHSLLHTWLTTVLNTYVDVKQLGTLAIAEYPVRLPREAAARQPDILFVSTKNQKRLTDKFVRDAADLAIEVVSPGTNTHDRNTKYREYEAAGVREYIIVDPRRKRADFFELVTRRYRPAALDNDGDVYRFRTIEGMWIEIDWLWKRPPVVQIFRRLGIV